VHNAQKISIIIITKNQSHTHSQTHTHARAHTHTQTHTNTHTHTQTHTHTHTCARAKKKEKKISLVIKNLQEVISEIQFHNWRNLPHVTKTFVSNTVTCKKKVQVNSHVSFTDLLVQHIMFYSTLFKHHYITSCLQPAKCVLQMYKTRKKCFKNFTDALFHLINRYFDAIIYMINYECSAQENFDESKHQ
jgi:hypothetical protein